MLSSLQPVRLLRGLSLGAQLTAGHKALQHPFNYLQSQQFATSSGDSNGEAEPLSKDTINTIKTSFSENRSSAAKQIVDSLSPTQRAALLEALESRPVKISPAYTEELFYAADKDGDRGQLTKSEFQHALQMHAMLDGSSKRSPPDWSALRMIFFASAIPFVAFGFLDNFIMLVAGDEIDQVFGHRLGLSTLASAGLGNCVADVIGVSAANGIEQSVRKLPFIKDPKLSKIQYAMSSTKMAKALGASIGVVFGCLLGLIPLFVSGTFFIPGQATA